MPPRVRTHTDLDAVRSAASAARAIEDVRGRFPGWSQHDGPGPNEVSFVLETQPWNYRIVVRARDDGAAKVFVRVWSRRALVLPPLARGGTMVLLGGVVLLGCGVGTAGAAAFAAAWTGTAAPGLVMWIGMAGGATLGAWSGGRLVRSVEDHYDPPSPPPLGPEVRAWVATLSPTA